MKIMLEKEFRNLISQYTGDLTRVDDYWRDIVMAYQQSKRHYHTMEHLKNVYNELVNCKEQLNDWMP
jgi:predicted metal-dependent HD superfamily phosphohydrolase